MQNKIKIFFKKKSHKDKWGLIGLSFITILIVFSFVILNSCTNKEDKNVIKIGAILPLTGPAANLGNDCKNGIELACNEFKQKGMKIILYFEDSQGKPDLAVNSFNKLVTTNIKIIIGDLFSSPTLAIAPLVEKNNAFLFSPGASNPKLSGISKYVFRNYPSDNFEGKLIAKYIRQKGYLKVAVIYPNNDYGVGLKNVFIPTFQKLGGKIIINEGYNENETDFRSILTKVLHNSVDALYLPGYYFDIGRIAVQFKQMGGNLPMFSNIGVEDPKLFEIAKGAVEGLIYTAPDVNLKSQSPFIQKFIKNYQLLFSKEPGFPAAYGYDTAKILCTVIKKYGNNPKSIRKGLLANTFKGVTGKTIFTSNGDVIKPFVLKIVKNNKFVVMKKIEK